MAAMEVGTSEFEPLDKIVQSKPDAAADVDAIKELTANKLYHQLTEKLLQLLNSLPADPTLFMTMWDFIKGFESKFDKVRFQQMLATCAKLQEPDVALAMIVEPATENEDAPSKWLMQCLKAEKLIEAGLVNGDASRYDEAIHFLDLTGNQIDATFGVEASIQATYHKTKALLWKALGRWHEFYQSSLLYMAFTPLSQIPAGERPEIAKEIVVAGLIAPDEFNFGELTQQDIVKSLEGSEYGWLRELLEAFAQGRFSLYDDAVKKHEALMTAMPQLDPVMLRAKMSIAVLLELALRKPKKSRRLAFDEVAEHCRVTPNEVEFVAMKAMCAKLICGKIDEVEQVIVLTWVKPRILDTSRIDLLRERMDAWKAQTSILLEHLEDMSPELLVS